MSTYFKFKDREDPSKSLIDWSGVTKSISEGIQKEKDRRAELKESLDKTYVDNLNTLENFSQGLDTTRNQTIQNFASNYRDFVHEQNKLLKSGQISPSQYRLVNQGAMDTFSNLNSAAQTYNDKLQSIAEAGGNINDFIAEKVADLSNINQKKMIIDPVTGMGSLADVDEDGKVIEKSIMPIQKINELMETKYPEFDMTASISDAMKNAGTWIEASSAYNSVKDLRQNPTYNKWLDARADSILAGSMGGILIADQYLGMEVTDDRAEAEANPDEFLFAENKGGNFDIQFVSPAQEKRVKEAVKNEIELAIGREATKKAPSAAVMKAGRDKRAKEASYRLIVDALKGDERALRTLAREAGYQGARIQNGQLVMVDAEGNNVAPISLDGTINSVGSEIAGQLGLGGEEFNNFYTQPDQVNTDAVSRYQPFDTPAAKQTIATAENIKSIYQPNYEVDDEETGERSVKARPRADVVKIAKQQSAPILQAAGITGVNIQGNGDVFYKGKKMGNAADGAEWLSNVQSEFNNSPQGGQTISVKGWNE